MSEHLSSLRLDEIAAGLVLPPAHLASCEDCTRGLELLQKERAAFLARPEAARQLEKLAPLPQRRSFLRVLVIAVPLAAGLALFLTWPRGPEERIKGSPTVMLLNEAGNVVTHASPGEKLTLAVGSAGFPRVEVFASDARGNKEPLYSGDVASGALVPLTRLEVTPGDVTVTAVFERGAEKQSVTVRLAVP